MFTFCLAITKHSPEAYKLVDLLNKEGVDATLYVWPEGEAWSLEIGKRPERVGENRCGVIGDFEEGIDDIEYQKAMRILEFHNGKHRTEEALR